MPPINDEPDAATSEVDAPLPRKSPTYWDDRASDLLWIELRKLGIKNYQDLALRLEAGGLTKTKGSLITRISRGTFSVAFFLQVARILGIDQINISHIPMPPAQRRSKQELIDAKSTK